MSRDKSLDRVESENAVAFEEIEHTADRALRIYGSNLKELLLNAAAGMYSLLDTEFAAADRFETKSVALEAIDAESLLVEWLSELAFWLETESLVFRKFDLHGLSPTHLAATIYGSRAAGLQKHIKAVTYHNLAITRTEKGLTATVVFDV